ncbi:MAG: 50S ribosomal protein L17 [Patescibacteria group bacterium]|jgi:large subunit ribosomal protein L17
MRHRNKNKILDRKRGPRQLMLRNLASSLIMYEKVQTTKAKAVAVRPLVEKMITVSKAQDLTARRTLASFLLHEKAVLKTLEVLAPRYAERAGGYTRMVKLGNRQGDGAEMVQLELV